MIDDQGKVRIRDNSRQFWRVVGPFSEDVSGILGGWITEQAIHPKATDLSAFGRDVYVVDDSGQLWKRSEQGDAFEKVQTPELVSQINMAEDRISIITKSGKVYMNGSNEFGQAGLGTQVHTEGEFVAIPDKYFEDKIAQVALGARHTLFRTVSGRIFACGSNDSMQLGLPWTREKTWLANEDWIEVVEKPASVQINCLESVEVQRSY